MNGTLHEEVVYRKGRGSYDEAIAEGERLIAEGYEPMREFRVEYVEPTGEWTVYFRMRKDIVDQFRRSRRMATRLAEMAWSYEIPANEAWGNVNEDLMRKSFHEKGVNVQTVEYDKPRKEIEVWFGSMMGKGQYPANLRAVMDYITHRIGAEGWLFRREDPWAISFSFAEDWVRAAFDRDRVVLAGGPPSRSAPVSAPPGRRNYKRNFDWMNVYDFNKGTQVTPFWDRQQQPESSGEGYNMGNRFNDADKAIDGPLAGLRPGDSVVMRMAAVDSPSTIDEFADNLVERAAGMIETIETKGAQYPIAYADLESKRERDIWEAAQANAIIGAYRSMADMVKFERQMSK